MSTKQGRSWYSEWGAILPVCRYVLNFNTMESITGASGNGRVSPVFRHPHDRYADRAAMLSGRTNKCASCSGRSPRSASWSTRPNP